MNAVLKPCELPCPKCGGMDIYRNYFAKHQDIEAEFKDKAPYPKHVYKGIGYKMWHPLREFISNACRTCHYNWQTLPLKGLKKLRAEPIPQGNSMIDPHTAYIATLNAQIAALAAQYEALEKDAARYRWLREGTLDDGPNVYADDDCNTWLHGAELDLAMDKAMARYEAMKR